jgi:hypothetical protein
VLQLSKRRAPSDAGQADAPRSFSQEKNPMNMVCPECALCQSFATLPMRLQTCPDCRRKGTDHYLSVPALEVRAPVPSRHEAEIVRREHQRLNGVRPA